MLTCDNALPHLLTDADLEAAARNLRAKLNPGGLLLAGIRDYDEVAASRPHATLPNVMDNVGRTRSTIKPDPGTLTVDVILTFSPEERKPGAPKRRRQEGSRGGSVEFP